MGEFYILRKAGPIDSIAFEMSKWEDGNIQPLDHYIMKLPSQGNTYSFLSCNCPSRSTPCKHWGIAQELLAYSEVNLPRLLWQEGTVIEAKDL